MKFVLTHNKMAPMSLRSRSRVKASMVLTRADNYCIHNYIRSLLNIILILILRPSGGRGSNSRPTDCVSDALTTETRRQYLPLE